MAFIFDSEFMEISITVFSRITGQLAFDIYIRRSENTYTKIFPKGDTVDSVRIDKYQIGKGVNTLYVHKDDYKQYLLYVDQLSQSFFDSFDQNTVEETIEVTQEMMNLTMLEIVVSCHVDQKSVTQAASAVRGCMQILQKDPKSMIKVMRYLTRHPYMIKHAITTAIFSLILAKSMKLESESSLQTVGLGALLHDIGMSHLSFDAEGKSEISPSEWKEIREHPHLGKKLLDGLRAATPQIKCILMQHHEQPNGMGYPNGLHDKDIFMPAKIVAIADSFSALISKRPYREEAFTPTKAIEIMYEDRGKYDLKILDEFSKIFVNVAATKRA